MKAGRLKIPGSLLRLLSLALLALFLTKGPILDYTNLVKMAPTEWQENNGESESEEQETSADWKDHDFPAGGWFHFTQKHLLPFAYITIIAPAPTLPSETPPPEMV